MKKKKNILFVVSNLKIGGGAEKFVSLITKELIKHYDVKVLTFYKTKNEYLCDVDRYDMGFNYKRNIILKFVRFLFLFPYELSKFLKKGKYDLIISNAGDANLVSLICKKFFYKNFKLWTLIQNNMDRSLYKYLLKMYKYSDKIITVSESLTKKYKNLSNKKEAVTIYNALDLDEIKLKSKEDIEPWEKKIFEDNIIITNVGRLVNQKNHHFLIDVFSSIRKDKENIKLLIFGDGPNKKELRKFIKSRDLERCVLLMGIRDNIFKYLNKSDVFVLTSKYEGFPVVLLEAISCGNICVANNCYSGPSEILNGKPTEELKLKKYKKGKYGYLVPYNNKKEFIKSIDEAIVKGKAYKKRAKKRAKDFAVKTIAKKWREEIERG